MADFNDEKDLSVEDTEETGVSTEGENAEETETGERDDLDDSLDAIKEEEEFEDTQYDDDNNYIGDDPEVTDENDWATPDSTPEGTDIPVSVDLELMGESMMEEGDAILNVLGVSGNQEFDSLVMDNKKSTVSYVDPNDPSHIIQEDSDKGEWEGLGFDSDYTDERTYDGDGSQAGNPNGGEPTGSGDTGAADFGDGNEDLGDDDEDGYQGDDADDPVEFTEEDYED